VSLRDVMLPKSYKIHDVSSDDESEYDSDLDLEHDEPYSEDEPEINQVSEEKDELLNTKKEYANLKKKQEETRKGQISPTIGTKTPVKISQKHKEMLDNLMADDIQPTKLTFESPIFHESKEESELPDPIIDTPRPAEDYAQTPPTVIKVEEPHAYEKFAEPPSFARATKDMREPKPNPAVAAVKGKKGVTSNWPAPTEAEYESYLADDHDRLEKEFIDNRKASEADPNNVDKINAAMNSGFKINKWLRLNYTGKRPKGKVIPRFRIASQKDKEEPSKVDWASAVDTLKVQIFKLNERKSAIEHSNRKAQ
jgi:hypothetical protein